MTLAGSKERGLVGVNAATGKFLWSYNGAAGGTAQIPTPIVKGDLVFTTDRLLRRGLARAARARRRRHQGQGAVPSARHHPGKFPRGVVLVGDKIYGGHGQSDGQPFCLDIQTGKFDWKPVRAPARGWRAWSTPTATCIFRYENNVLALVEATPAGYKLKSKFQIPGDLDSGFPSPVIAHGRLYIRAKDVVLCYDLRQK